MAETLVTDRLISGTGVLRIPLGISAVRYYSVLVDVVRQPVRTDRSLRYNPYRQRFAQVTFLRHEYVIAEEHIDYSRRRFDFPVNENGQVLIALKCSHSQTMTQFGVLGAEGASNISEFANLSLIWDEMRVVCFLDTALQVRLFQDTYDECGEDYNEKSPPPPPPPLPPVPPGTPIGDISPPYDDDDVTSPYPGDESPPPDPCADVGWWSLTYTPDVSGGSITLYIRGKEDDVFSDGLFPEGGCRDNMRQDLLCNGSTAYMFLGCGQRATDIVYTYLGMDYEPTGTIITNALYPDC